MKALVFDFKPVRYACSKILGTFYPEAYFGRFSALSYREYPEPELPGDEWVKVRTAYGGICGSDLHAVFLRGSWDNPTTPFISFPMVLGHEIVGTIEMKGRDVNHLDEGERVLINPILSCTTRGIDPPCPPCRDGNVALCHSFAEGNLPPGIMLGVNRRINGGFASYVVAHRDQCLRIPQGISFEEAVVADPFGTSLRAILQNPPRPGEKVLVYGCGMLGLSAVISLRTLYPECHIIAVGKHAFQRAHAARFGAHQVLSPGASIFQAVAEATGGNLYRPYRGKPILMGGVAVVYDCVGSGGTIEASLRLTDSKGKVVVIGVDTPKRFEWSPIWFREVSVVGSMEAGAESFQGRRMHTFQVFLELLEAGTIDVKPLITHRFRLGQYKNAFKACLNKRSTSSIKVLFDFL